MFRVTQVALIVLLLSGVLNQVLSFGVSNLYKAVLRAFLLLTGQM